MIDNNSKEAIKPDLSLLAIEAAEELARLKNGKKTEFKSLETLSAILNESKSKNLATPNSNYRLDHFTMISSAGSILKKSPTEIAGEAIKIISKKDKLDIESTKDSIEKLISFFVALSDSATIYNQELDELSRDFAYN